MNPLTNILQTSFLIKIFSLVVLSMYLVFSFVIFTQINTMNKAIHVPSAGPILKIIAILNIIAALSLLLLSLAIL